MFVQSNTVKDLKRYFSKKLELHFSPSEVKLMFSIALEKRLGIPGSEILLRGDDRLSESDLLFMRSIAHRLLENEPFQYIIGETEFCGLTLDCDKRALIPRPETEELVAWIAGSFPREEALSMADFCSGSGCIALALKSYFPKAYIRAYELSEEALALSRQNAARNHLDVSFVQADILNFPGELIADGSLDLIVSNPPYIPEKDKGKMQANVLTFEPHMALFVSDHDPLSFYRKIAGIAAHKLKKGGQLFFEMHEDLAQEVRQLLVASGFDTVEWKEDLQGKKRMIKALK